MKPVKTASTMLLLRTKQKGVRRCVNVFAITALIFGLFFFASQSNASVVDRIELPGRKTQVRTELQVDPESAVRLSLPENIKKYVITSVPLLHLSADVLHSSPATNFSHVLF